MGGSEKSQFQPESYSPYGSPESTSTDVPTFSKCFYAESAPNCPEYIPPGRLGASPDA